MHIGDKVWFENKSGIKMEGTVVQIMPEKQGVYVKVPGVPILMFAEHPHRLGSEPMEIKTTPFDNLLQAIEKPSVQDALLLHGMGIKSIRLPKAAVDATSIDKLYF